MYVFFLNVLFVPEVVEEGNRDVDQDTKKAAWLQYLQMFSWKEKDEVECDEVAGDVTGEAKFQAIEGRWRLFFWISLVLGKYQVYDLAAQIQ